MTASLPAGLALQPLPQLPVATKNHREWEATHRAECGLRRTRPATKLETWALTERVESCSHRGQSFCIALWLSLGRTLIDCHLLERNLLKTSIGGMEFDFFPFYQLPLYWTADACIKGRSNKSLTQHLPDFQEGKKLSALAYLRISISFYMSAYITLCDVWFTLCV